MAILSQKLYRVPGLNWAQIDPLRRKANEENL
jgi:hypothetical protein